MLHSLYELGEGKSLSEEHEGNLWSHFVQALHESTGIRINSSHTRKHLQKSPDLREWLEAEHKQWHDMADCQMYADPVLRNSCQKELLF